MRCALAARRRVAVAAGGHRAGALPRRPGVARDGAASGWRSTISFCCSSGCVRRKQERQASEGIPIAADADLLAAWAGGLPFRLTGAQQSALAEILRDMDADEADGPAAAGGRRFRQDGGRRRGDAGRHGGGPPGGADGADRDSGRAASARVWRCSTPRCRTTMRPTRAPADRVDPGRGTARDSGRAPERRGRHPGRHPRADPGWGRRAAAGAHGRRRAAPLRGAAAGGAAREGRGDGCRTNWR